MSTPNLGLAQVPTGTLEPSIPINDALQLLDAVVQLTVQDKDLTAPPTTVGGDVGKRWIVGGSATDAWSGHDDDIALCTGADLWRFITPSEGWRADVRDEDATYRFDGSAWVLFAGGGSGSAPKITSTVTSNTITPDDDTDLVRPSATLTAGLTIANPSGTPADGWGMVLELKDNGTTRTLTWGSKYASRCATLPTATTVGKQHVVVVSYNATDDKLYCDSALVQP